ncbi:MAG: hypothetical protein E6J28_02655 [Chloroflexi bacterium]|nr:MAG: hypothetical protein E6J28_02655 [Chloroflexota bacterium]
MRHRWYYRLTPEGEFAKGRTIRWVDGGGAPAEESEVVELEAPNRLVMHTRYLYAPAGDRDPPQGMPRAHVMGGRRDRGRPARVRGRQPPPGVAARARSGGAG